MRRFIIIVILGLGLTTAGWWQFNRSPKPASQDINFNTNSMSTLSLHSPAFTDNEEIPTKYTCDGENISPPLRAGELPAAVKYLAIVFDDPMAVSGTFDHWTIWNIPAQAEIPENFSGGILGKNSRGQAAYTGPCPPNGEHRYHFRVFGYGAPLTVSAGATKQELLMEIDGQAIASGELFGRYGANR